MRVSPRSPVRVEEVERTTQDEDRRLIQNGYYGQKDREARCNPYIYTSEGELDQQRGSQTLRNNLPDHVIPVCMPFLHFSILLSTILDRKADARVFVDRNR